VVIFLYINYLQIQWHFAHVRKGYSKQRLQLRSTREVLPRRNGRPRQRNLLSLKRVDEGDGQVDKVLHSLLNARGHSPRDISMHHQVQFESALTLSDVCAIDQLWRKLGFNALAGVFRRERFSTLIGQAIRMPIRWPLR
jgi:hypothetical protein